VLQIPVVKYSNLVCIYSCQNQLCSQPHLLVKENKQSYHPTAMSPTKPISIWLHV